MKIVFLGEGVIAANALCHLFKQFKVVCILTTERDQRGTRKQKLKPVTDFAGKHNIPIKYVGEINADILEYVGSFDPDILIAVSFGLFLPSSILRYSKLIPINLHPSALPKFRGAAPIARAIECGDQSIGVCVIEIIKRMDAGDILLQRDLAIDMNTYASDLYPKIGDIGGKMLCDVIFQLSSCNNKVNRIKQDDNNATLAPKIQKDELILDFNDNAVSVVNRIRAFDVFGGCSFVMNSTRVKILRAVLFEVPVQKPHGTIDPEYRVIHCKFGTIKPLLLQRAGKPVVNADNFWNGYKQG